MSKNVADQLVEELVKVGIHHFYSISGDSLNAVNTAINKNDALRWIMVRHEESGAFAASAEAFLNGVACCAGSSGPGHVHLVNGLYDANHGHNAVVAIASTCSSGEYGTDFFQETNTIKLFDDCSVYNQVAVSPKQFARMMPAAIRAAIASQGVAVVALPGNVANQDAEEVTEVTYEPAGSSVRASQQQIHALADVIHQSKKITLFCGIGAESARDEVIKLAELLKAPVAYTFKAKMEMEFDNPYAVGITGLLGVPSAYVSMYDADLLILLGCDFPYSNFLPTNCKIAQVDIRAEHIGRRVGVDVDVHGDVRDTIKQLIPLLNERSNSSFLDKCVTLYKDVEEDLTQVASYKGSQDKIAPEYLTRLIDEKASERAIFTVDTGMCCIWASRFLRAAEEREMIASYNHGSMSNALPMAIGSALARPDQQVVALCGDGGLSMILGELMTVKQYNLPIKIVVYKNRTLGMVKMEMQFVGILDTETDLIDPDFAAVARAMGIDAYSVRNPDELSDVLDEVFAHIGPVLVEVYTDPNALSLSPKFSLRDIKGFSMSMAQMLVKDRRQELINTIKANFKLM